MTGRPYEIDLDDLEACLKRFLVWLTDRGGIIVYAGDSRENFGRETVFKPARMLVEGGFIDAPDEMWWWWSNPIGRRKLRKIDHIELREFEGDMLACVVACFAERRRETS